ncbi:GTP 3',8-cyclase MoaA [Pontibacter rugosus]|uniref:GTP 3',8-cyclase n=1 Tax=Pontibacter rugosus TaxID=1745966 RepID=A0ABW3SLJ3_9BACT
MMRDKHNRAVNYLRLSVTDKCNLRCFYCMPEEGIPFCKKDEELSFEELLRICSILTAQGVDKIRITGGEPFVRKDLMLFLEKLTKLENAPEISITTNATLIGPHILKLKQLGIRSINVSLDTLDENRFFTITRRDEYKRVMQNLTTLMQEGFDVKINCVVMQDQNIEDIPLLAQLTKNYPISVRFLEEMPFNAQSEGQEALLWNYTNIKANLEEHFGELEKLQDPASSTSLNYRIKGYKGEVGIIPSFSRTFCGTCNRIRLSANGDFRTCLYGAADLNLRDQLRLGFTDEQLLNNLQEALQQKAKNGFEAETRNLKQVKDSMAYLGG